MSVQDYPCGDCPDCLPIGEGEGLCDYLDPATRKFIVDLYEMYPDCPKPKKEKPS